MSPQWRMFYLSVGLVLCAPVVAYAQTKNVNDEQIQQQIINNSIASYPGHCPCPYNQASNGSRCGKRSAWSRPGGYMPICYKTDVTKEMIKQWREMHKTR